MRLTIELPAREEQLAFNRKRWDDVLADSALASLPYRVETNCEGKLIMRPPPELFHSNFCGLIAKKLGGMLPAGRVLPEAPINTIDGVRAADVAWISDSLWRFVGSGKVLEQAPEICVEVLSPSNTPVEMRHKKKLYFDAGANEVWFCDMNGELVFFLATEPMCERQRSQLCPEFPARIVEA